MKHLPQSDFTRPAPVASAVIEQITPLLITYNEAPNIARTLDKLRWATRIVLVDSGSTDLTLQIASQFPQVEAFHRPFDTFAEQCNFGLSLVRSAWVLSLDADYELSDALVSELRELENDPSVAGYYAEFVYRIHGRALRATLYPPRVVLYRVRGASYRNEGHGHRVAISGPVRSLRGSIYHDDRKPLSRWFESQQGYARREADYLLNSEASAMSRTDRIRRLGWPAPILILFYVLFGKACIFDGRAGWFYALQRLLAETMIALEILDRRFLGKSEGQRER